MAYAPQKYDVTRGDLLSVGFWNTLQKWPMRRRSMTSLVVTSCPLVFGIHYKSGLCAAKVWRHSWWHLVRWFLENITKVAHAPQKYDVTRGDLLSVGFWNTLQKWPMRRRSMTSLVVNSCPLVFGIHYKSGPCAAEVWRHSWWPLVRWFLEYITKVAHAPQKYDVTRGDLLSVAWFWFTQFGRRWLVRMRSH